MPQPNIPKGNPAGKRMSNPSHAAVRAASWARAQRRSAAHRAAQVEREKANRLLVEGLPGLPAKRPSKQARYARRHGLVAAA